LLRLLRLEAKQQISDAFEEKQANQNETKKEGNEAMRNKAKKAKRNRNEQK
jgi:hypothetical protein